MTFLSKVNLKAGLHRESTQYEEEGKWFDGDHVRFRSGKPENMRGYETKVSTAFDGSARDLIVYKSGPYNKKRAVFGTPDKLYEHDGDRIVDITPMLQQLRWQTVLVLPVDKQEYVVLMLDMDR